MNDMNQSDHDILIEVKTRLNELIRDVKEMKDGTQAKIEDHEHRIQYLEKYKGAIMTNSGLMWGAWGILLTLMVIHLLQ